MEDIETRLESFGVNINLESEGKYSLRCSQTADELVAIVSNSDIHSLDTASRANKTIASTSRDDLFKILLRRNEVLGFLIAEKSKFDTEHFGFKIGKLKMLRVSEELHKADGFFVRNLLIQECLAWMKKLDIKCLISRANYDDLLNLIVHERNGFRLADALLTFQLDITSFCGHAYGSCENTAIRPFKSDEENTLMNIANCAFKNDHFHRDPNFPNKKCDELFSKWVYNCCHGLADFILVANVKNKVVGFITCKIKKTEDNKQGIIDLIAVSPSFQKNGVGKALVSHSIEAFRALGAESILVGTQANNVGATRTYEQLGFKLTKTELTFHKWLEESL